MKPFPRFDQDLYCDALLENPYGAYRTLRDLGPLVRLPALDLLAVSRFDDVRAALRADQALISGEGVAANDVVNRRGAPITLTSDGETHARRRRILIDPVSPGPLKTLKAELEAEAEILVARLADGRTFCAMEAFASHLPVTVVAERVGLNEVGRRNMLRWAGATFNALGVMNPRGLASLPIMRELGAYVATLERDHVSPGGWADRLFDAADRGELSPEEARSMVIDYVGPSLDTTILATGFMVHCLATTEGALDAVRDDPSLVPSVVNEVVRLSSPIRGFTRLASEDVELGGWTAPKGARLLILYASANRDERRYESPDAFRVTRNPRDHVGWGHGAHTCVGIHLARLEMEVLLSALVGQVGRIETDEPTRLLNNVLQGFTTLPTRFHKHHALGARPPRRQVLGAVAASLIAPEAARASSRPPKAPGFVWGVAAASAQTESRGGRGRSNWDVFADTPGKIGDGSTNARCTEFETRYPRDLDLLKAGGVGAFRMSIAWPRIQPDGPGQPSAAGLDTYDRIIDAMLARGIDPWVTLFHWDTPIWAGDFRDRDITRRMADYADIVVARLGDRVTHWIMLNEPNSVAFLGYFQGVHAPGLSSLQAGLAAIHHQNLAGGLMARAARSRARPGSRIGTTINVVATRPASPTPEDARAAAALDMFWNGAFLDPLFGKGYPAPVAPRVAPLAQAGDMDVIATPLDFLGVNNYSRIYARATGTAPGFEVGTFPPGLPQTANYPVEPGGLTDALVLVRQRYGAIPIVVTETGFALTNEPDWRAELADDRRIAYVDQYLSAAAAARAQGVDLRGLFYWAATDNWEWAKGFAPRYGMIAVDPKTQARAAKRSLSRYGGLIRSHFPDAV